MHKLKSLTVLTLALLFSARLEAQIFINTGNPRLEEYKKNNPNGFIWEDGKGPSSQQPVTPGNTNTNTSTGATVPVTAPVSNINTNKNSTPAVKTTTKYTSVTETPVSEVQPSDYPPNAIPGKCYARCYKPDQYEYREEQVIDKPAYTKTDKIPAKYETVFDTIVLKPAMQRTYLVPPEYAFVEEDTMVAPATKKWVKGKADKNCLSANPKDCEVLCLVEVPPVYKKITRRVEKVPATERVEEIPAVTKVVPRKQLIEAAHENKTEVPATYKTIMNKVLVAKGGYQEWHEVLCEQDVTVSKVSAIQMALKREGYDPGPIDNNMGGKTKEALIKFQQDKGLPVGNLNMETLKALGVQ